MHLYGIVGVALLIFMFGLMFIEDAVDRRYYFQLAVLKLASGAVGGCMFGAWLALIISH